MMNDSRRAGCRSNISSRKNDTSGGRAQKRIGPRTRAVVGSLTLRFDVLSHVFQGLGRLIEKHVKILQDLLV
jgi:hypothetical protein